MSKVKGVSLCLEDHVAIVSRLGESDKHVMMPLIGNIGFQEKSTGEGILESIFLIL